MVSYSCKIWNFLGQKIHCPPKEIIQIVVFLHMFKGGEGVNAGVGEVEWVVAKERSACMISSLRIILEKKSQISNVVFSLHFP